MGDIALQTISLHDLESALPPGLTKAWGQFLCEASITCLEYQNHVTGVELFVDGINPSSFNLLWNRHTSSQSLDAWNDDGEKAEFGAMGLACLLVLKLTDYTVIRRSKKGTGFDYWLGNRDEALPMQDSARLEISGIMRGTNSQIRARIKKKTAQPEVSDSTGLPAYAIVVEFSQPTSYLAKR